MEIFYCTPFLTAIAPAGSPGAPLCQWDATPVTGVHWADHEIGRGAPQPPVNVNFG